MGKRIRHFYSTKFNIVESAMSNAFGDPTEWCWFNISIQHRSILLNSTCWTHFATLVNDVDSTFPFNNVQHCRIQHVKHVWSAPCWMMLIQHVHSILLNLTCWTRLASLLNDVDPTFPLNTFQHCWIQHVERVWSPRWMMFIQHFYSTPFNIVEFAKFNAFHHLNCVNDDAGGMILNDTECCFTKCDCPQRMQ